MTSSQELKTVRGHQFVEINYHTPSNCDVCSKTLPWSLNIMRRGECSYECQRMSLSLSFSITACTEIAVKEVHMYSMGHRLSPQVSQGAHGEKCGGHAAVCWWGTEHQETTATHQRQVLSCPCNWTCY